MNRIEQLYQNYAHEWPQKMVPSSRISRAAGVCLIMLIGVILGLLLEHVSSQALQMPSRMRYTYANVALFSVTTATVHGPFIPFVIKRIRANFLSHISICIRQKIRIFVVYSLVARTRCHDVHTKPPRNNRK